jgi:hypothetical protein
MVGKHLLFGGPIAALCLLITFGAIGIRAREASQPVAAQPEAAVADEPMTAVQLQSLRISVAQAKPVSVSMLVQDFTGAFTQANVKAQVTAVEQEALKQNLDSVWGNTHPGAVVIVLEDPTNKPQVRLQVGLTLPHAGVHATEPLKVVTMNFPTAVKYVHQGQYQKIGTAFRTMHTTLQQSGRSAAFPVVLSALDDPGRVPAAELRTVVLTPVK